MVDQTYYLPTVTVHLAIDLILFLCQDRADTECTVTIFTIHCLHVDDLYRSMICVEHAHYIVMNTWTT